MGATFAVAWTSASRSAGASPLAPGIWPFFLQRHATISLGASAALLCPVRVVMVVPWFFQYRRTIAWMEGKIGLRDKFPLLNRVMAVAVTWVVANVAAVVLLTSVLIWIGSLWTGIPVFPLAP
uniref:Uncharacterized protein n=1 Tax=Trieres chinensis TaxID=1514140 RepID=A0A7S1Z967_TRICV